MHFRLKTVFCPCPASPHPPQGHLSFLSSLPVDLCLQMLSVCREIKVKWIKFVQARSKAERLWRAAAPLMNKGDRVSNKKWHRVKQELLVRSQHRAPTIQGPVCCSCSLLKGSLCRGSVNKMVCGANKQPPRSRRGAILLRKLLWVKKKKVTALRFKTSHAKLRWFGNLFTFLLQNWSCSLSTV